MAEPTLFQQTPGSRVWWEQKARDMYESRTGTSDFKNSDPHFDAFRHAYTNAVWTWLSDPAFAKAGGDYVELKNENNFKSPEGTRDMNGDLYNNDVGRQIGGQPWKDVGDIGDEVLIRLRKL
jgi:hypothetical protein